MKNMKTTLFVAAVLIFQIPLFSFAATKRNALNVELKETETYVIKRDGKNVTVLLGENSVSDFSKINRKNPTQVLAAFFFSYFSRTDYWKNLVAESALFYSGIYGEDGEPTAIKMEEAWNELYGLVDSISIKINPANFKSNGDGSAYYTLEIALSYKGESDSGEDEATIVQKENGEWFVYELPR